MPLYINTNVASLNAQRNLMGSTNKLGSTFARLASGLRVNSAKDDAAGMAIGQRMTSQVRGLSQAVRNANDGISLGQVAEGALEETGNALQRIRELAVQAANDTNNASDRADLQEEVNVLVSEIQRISSQTEFNTQTVLDGTYKAGTAAKFQIGANENQTVEVTIGAAYDSALLGTTTASGGLAGAGSVVLTTQADANATISQISNALDSVADIRAKLGAMQSRFESVVANLSNVVENVSAARSRILDADVAAETATLTRNAILQQAGTAILAQANQQPQLALQLLG
ncbi:MAG: flagellin FliC [Magnetococcales bacterium]|nr:flagellin FliC [Magnetococcales bacterium]